MYKECRREISPSAEQVFRVSVFFASLELLTRRMTASDKGASGDAGENKKLNTKFLIISISLSLFLSPPARLPPPMHIRHPVHDAHKL